MSSCISIKRVPPFSWNSKGLEFLCFKKKMENVVKFLTYKFSVESILKPTHALKKCIFKEST